MNILNVPGDSFAWPDPTLRFFFRELLDLYQIAYSQCLGRGNPPQTAQLRAFDTTCRCIEASFQADRPGNEAIYHEVEALTERLRETYSTDVLQALVCLLGMMVHYSTSSEAPALLINRRRPNRYASSYPNSPLLTRFVSDYLFTRFLKTPLEALLTHPEDPEAHAARTLNMRILDPSVESGQLLLAVVLTCMRFIEARSGTDRANAAALKAALLRQFYTHCLWGCDRNQRSIRATESIFSILGATQGIDVELKHLLHRNAFDLLEDRYAGQFSLVINNPPWGERLSEDDRRALRYEFTCGHRWLDSYVAFVELAFHLLCEGGGFALILPSQFVATTNAARLRRFLSQKAEIDQLIVLPRQAFTDATVRGAVVMGRKKTSSKRGRVRVVVYPSSRNASIIRTPTLHHVEREALDAMGTQSWMPVLFVKNDRTRMQPSLPLGKLATIITGVKLYEQGKGTPPQTTQIVREKPYTFDYPAEGTVPALRGRQVHSFRIHAPDRFIRFGEWLSWTGNHAWLRTRPRIVLRELRSRNGNLSAAFTDTPDIALHGVHTILPHGINMHVLVAILNSQMIAEHVVKTSASQLKVDFQRLTVGEFERLPIPTSAIVRLRPQLGLPPRSAKEKKQCDRIAGLTKQIQSTYLDPAKDGAEALKARLNEAVGALYIG